MLQQTFFSSFFIASKEQNGTAQFSLAQNQVKCRSTNASWWIKRSTCWAQKKPAYSSLLAMKRPPCDGYNYWQKFCGKLGWCQLHNIMKANSSNWLLFSWHRSVTDLREKCARELRGHRWKPREGLMLARERSWPARWTLSLPRSTHCHKYDGSRNLSEPFQNILCY